MGNAVAQLEDWKHKKTHNHVVPPVIITQGDFHSARHCTHDYAPPSTVKLQAPVISEYRRFSAQWGHHHCFQFWSFNHCLRRGATDWEIGCDSVQWRYSRPARMNSHPDVLGCEYFLAFEEVSAVEISDWCYKLKPNLKECSHRLWVFGRIRSVVFVSNSSSRLTN